MNERETKAERVKMGRYRERKGERERKEKKDGFTSRRLTKAELTIHSNCVTGKGKGWGAKDQLFK